MKHLHTFESFLNEANKPVKIGWSGEGYIDTAKKEITITYDSNEWDSYRKFEKDLKYLAAHQNDFMSEEIEKALQGSGWTVDYSKDGTVDDDTVTLKLVKA